MRDNIINHYKLKNDTTINKILHELRIKRLPVNIGGEYINENAYYCTFKTLVDDISINIAFPEDLSKWDDIDYVLVLDERFGQPYTPFYENSKPFMYLLNVIRQYNNFMDSLNFFERR